jgi:photosystem II stability/assembly factor-like uncharacterized protein
MRSSHVVFATLLISSLAVHAQVQDLTANYLWKPVRIGAGGWVTGMVLHPLDPNVRYLRTDVGNAYRWDIATQSWLPMRLANPDGSGIHAPVETSSPSGYGIDAIAVDPANTSTVYLTFTTETSCDIQCPTHIVQLYRSSDGGRNFAPLNLASAAIKADANSPNRMDGERLTVDPANPKILYYASLHQGLFRSLDQGQTWTVVPNLPTNIEFLHVDFAPHTRTLYAITIHNPNDTGGDVYRSLDAGQSWADISTNVTDPASHQRLGTQALTSTIDAAGNLYIPENPSTNGNHRAFWRYANSTWQRISLEGAINQPLSSVAIDPTNPRRLYAMAIDTSLSRSDDGGLTWTSFGPPRFANILGWLPQTVGMSAGNWHSNGGLRLDAHGNLWVPTGQEGALTLPAAEAARATAANPPRWIISSIGVEEMVSKDLLIPHGSHDTIIATAMDTTGFVIPNPDTFSARQIPLQQEIIAQGTSVDAAPDVPTYIAVTSSNPYTNGPSYSGYSADGGTTWHRFASTLKFPCAPSKQCDVQAGTIAVGLFGTNPLGRTPAHAHIVQLPPNNFAPQYSLDGGATWHVTHSFPLLPDGLTLDKSRGALGLFVAQLGQHLLRADPFTPDRFYLKLTQAPASLYVSTDTGQTWLPQPKANLPDGAYHGQLVVNPFLPNDLWYADGWEGSSAHGIFHSTDAAATFTRLPAVAHAITIAIGASSPQPGSALYTLYLYGQLSTDTAWGVFQSIDAGLTWNRIAFYPTGIYDHPTTMAASPDTFGKVYLGFTGNSFVYSQLVPIAEK